ncbi:hypothetical protein B5E84_11180 [Lachnoclostridium sp. An14]|uniref:hypothetical protein n=1 Tax=Lachnoclostridium sp. An14 TaxID=1965562 RepID=UPI000B38F983|nr:hypothetical protein [Lachnoclostridium sp. An14]OUQ17012.1 hypothetical protein B5E84_11180 [Lachnoclostridium sp. An14]
MLNEDKIGLMTGIAMFEKQEGKRISMAGRMFKSDFVGRHMLHAFLRFTIAYVLVLGVWAMASVDRLLSTADLEEFMGLGATAGIWYAAGLVIYLLVTRNIYARRYDEAARAVRVYTAKLRRLKKRYEFQNRKKELTKGGRHHDGTSRI